MKKQTQERKAPAVYLIEDGDQAPGRILAVFAHLEDAERFCPETACIVERTLWYGQPTDREYNP